MIERWLGHHKNYMIENRASVQGLNSLYFIIQKIEEDGAHAGGRWRQASPISTTLNAIYHESRPCTEKPFSV